VAERLDITEGEHIAQASQQAAGGRPFLMVMFACANAYQKVFRSLDGTHYAARCPKCGMTKRFAVGAGGASQRQFRLTCQ
jgi:hypothetical protein